MRQNLPVNNNEYQVPTGINLVSKTDLHGTITECNDAFETASGFSREELIGQPHNMIRHPDVPPAVFKDMWNTLKQGKPWTQLVKNRRKDGGFYWVRANATPIFEHGEVTGYMSVRSAISQSEKTSAAEAYQAIANGSVKIEYGQVFSGLNWKKYDISSKLPLAMQLPILVALFAILPAGIDWYLGQSMLFSMIGIGLLTVLALLVGFKS